MLEIIYKSILYLHIALGSVSLLVFLIPMFLKKGSKLHRKIGWVYVYSMWGVIVSALMLSVINLVTAKYLSALFLGFLAILTAGPLWFGIAILKYKKNIPVSYIKTKKIFSALVLVMGIVNLAAAAYMKFQGMGIALLFFGILGLVSGQELFQSGDTIRNKANWYKDHLSGLIVGGIAAYTAFFAFGGRALFASVLTESLMVIPWIAPSVIGSVVIRWYKRQYDKKVKKV